MAACVSSAQSGHLHHLPVISPLSSGACWPQECADLSFLGLRPIAATPAGTGPPCSGPSTHGPSGPRAALPTGPPASCSQRPHCRGRGGTGRRGAVPRPDTPRGVPGKDTCQGGTFRAPQDTFSCCFVRPPAGPGPWQASCWGRTPHCSDTADQTPDCHGRCRPSAPERLRGPRTRRGRRGGDGVVGAARWGQRSDANGASVLPKRLPRPAATRPS